jgi:hypothetical protein
MGPIMFSPIDITAYLSILLVSYDIHKPSIISYNSYTTTHIITNSDMYDVNKIIEKAFMQEEK